MEGYFDYGKGSLPVIIFLDYDESPFPTKTFTEHHHATDQIIRSEAVDHGLNADELLDAIRKSSKSGSYMVWIDVPLYRKSQAK